MSFFPTNWRPIEQPTFCIDELVFGKDAKYPLPAMNGYNWIDQIDETKPQLLHVAVAQFLSVVQSSWKIAYGQRYLANYDDNLLQAMGASRVASTMDKESFDNELGAGIGSLLNVGDDFDGIDMALRISTFGNVVSRFANILKPHSVMSSIVDLVRGNEKVSKDDAMIGLRDALVTYSKAIDTREISVDRGRIGQIKLAMEMTRDFLDGHPLVAQEFDSRTQPLSSLIDAYEPPRSSVQSYPSAIF
jgi:hypothetical protein